MPVRETSLASGRLASAGLLIVALVLTWLGPRLPLADDSSHQPAGIAETGGEPARLREVLASIDEEMPRGSGDLAMAWRDLRSDLDSMSHDLERHAPNVDMRAMLERVSGFVKQFGTSESMPAKHRWDDLVDVIERIVVATDE